jgi:hypothetical protein
MKDTYWGLKKAIDIIEIEVYKIHRNMLLWTEEKDQQLSETAAIQYKTAESLRVKIEDELIKSCVG